VLEGELKMAKCKDKTVDDKGSFVADFVLATDSDGTTVPSMAEKAAARTGLPGDFLSYRMDEALALPADSTFVCRVARVPDGHVLHKASEQLPEGALFLTSCGKWLRSGRQPGCGSVDGYIYAVPSGRLDDGQAPDAPLASAMPHAGRRPVGHPHVAPRFELLDADGPPRIVDLGRGGAVVAALTEEYGHAVCLERAAGQGGMTGLCAWLNSMSKDDLDSELPPARRTMDMRVVCDASFAVKVEASSGAEAREMLAADLRDGWCPDEDALVEVLCDGPWSVGGPMSDDGGDDPDDDPEFGWLESDEPVGGPIEG
jgi:hypothetical protein